MYGHLYERLRALRGTKFSYDEITPAVFDELALEIAKDCIGKFPDQVRLTQHEWTRLTAVFQSKISSALRHVVCDPVPFPGPSKPPEQKKDGRWMGC